LKEKLKPSNVAIVFLQTAQYISNEISKKLEPLDISSQQLKILSIVAFSEEKKVTVNEIKAEMFDPMSNVSRLLNKLMDKKLIVKIRDEKDQRLVFIEVTKEGLDLLYIGKKAMDEALKSFDSFNEKELEVMLSYKNKVKQ